MRKQTHYLVFVHKQRNSDYGVAVPDLPGCFTAGSTIDEALAMAREAIELHLEGLAAEGAAIPEPRRIEDYHSQPDFKGGTWALVSVSPPSLRAAAQRINITMPRHVLRAVDRFARARNESRSGLLAKAATAYIRQEPEPSAKPRPRVAAPRKGAARARQSR